MTLHVIGAGLSGLTCALAAADAGLSVVIHEATRLAGGRCRSWDDAVIGRRIDNGTHVVVGGNPAVFAFLRRTVALDRLRVLPTTPRAFDAVNAETIQLNWLAMARAYLSSRWRLGFDDRGTVRERLGDLADYRALWDPLAVATLNTDPSQGSAALFRAVLASTVWRGPAAARMHVARDDLSTTFVVPALEWLRALGAAVRFGEPLREPVCRNGRAVELKFDDESILLSRHDALVLAVPWWTASEWLGLPAMPDSAIVNAHFRLAAPPTALADHAALGVVGGTAQWVFRRGDVLAVTVSAADGLEQRDSDEVADLLWADVARALNLSEPPAAVRVVKEKRATLLHTENTEALRPTCRQGDNLFLAGDWTATGLPCTIEGAIRSGNRAADEVVALLRDRRQP